jgi:hypothetical protein
MWLSNSKKYAMDRFLEERASSGSVHQVVMHGSPAKCDGTASKLNVKVEFWKSVHEVACSFS